jgi:hypothetical protein
MIFPPDNQPTRTCVHDVVRWGILANRAGGMLSTATDHAPFTFVDIDIQYLGLLKHLFDNILIGAGAAPPPVYMTEEQWCSARNLYRQAKSAWCNMPPTCCFSLQISVEGYSAWIDTILETGILASDDSPTASELATFLRLLDYHLQKVALAL